MELAFKFFDKIKLEMERDAVIKIAYHMRKFFKKLRLKRMEAEARKLAAKDKNSKYGNKYRK
jgi:hypothetical protein